MHTKTLIFALVLFAAPVFAQQEQQTLFKKEKVRGGFGGPLFTWSDTKGRTGYGAGGGGGVVFDRLFVGFFGVGETFDNPKIDQPNLAAGYGGLWLGYSIPSHKVAHLFSSVKLGIGQVGVTDFYDDWEVYENWEDFVFVAVPEVGVELNIPAGCASVARWGTDLWMVSKAAIPMAKKT
jgi:hypothetical protein